MMNTTENTENSKSSQTFGFFETFFFPFWTRNVMKNHCRKLENPEKHKEEKEQPTIFA